MSAALIQGAIFEDPLDFVLPEAGVVNLGKLVLPLADRLPQIGLRALLEPQVKDQLFAFELGAPEI